MKPFGIFWTRLRASVSAIHPVDRCLILFAVVLLAQSVYSLFAPEETPLAGNIDTMVRTSLAAVFGYFLSSNFNAGSSGKSAQEETTSHRAEPLLEETPSELSPASAPSPQREAQQEAAPQAKPVVSKAAEAPATVSRLQIFLAAGIGLVCLMALLALRCHPSLAEHALSGSPAATVTQFRDLVSGCIGFLIGCPVHGSASEP